MQIFRISRGNLLLQQNLKISRKPLLQVENVIKLDFESRSGQSQLSMYHVKENSLVVPVRVIDDIQWRQEGKSSGDTVLAGNEQLPAGSHVSPSKIEQKKKRKGRNGEAYISGSFPISLDSLCELLNTESHTQGTRSDGLQRHEISVKVGDQIDTAYTRHLVSRSDCTDVSLDVNQQVADQVLPPGTLPSYPPPSAFLGPKCALWDCLRPAFKDSYCSEFHRSMAAEEGGNGRAPVVRPWGIELKDPLLLAALKARILGKAVGIPDCERAATAKSPWNAPELFDVNMLAGETIREWLFFDKSQPAYGTGTRRQRALPDYHGRWHDSYKQHFKEHGGLKRILYLDPQPTINEEWHLYEYELKGTSEWALYRLEVKAKNSNKGAQNMFAEPTQKDGHKSAFTAVKPRPI